MHVGCHGIVGRLDSGGAGRERALNFHAVQISHKTVIPIHGQQDVQIGIDRVVDLNGPPQVNGGVAVPHVREERLTIRRLIGVIGVAIPPLPLDQVVSSEASEMVCQPACGAFVPLW